MRVETAAVSAEIIPKSLPTTNRTQSIAVAIFNAGYALTVGLINLLGRTVRELIHPFYFVATGYIPRTQEARFQQNLKIINAKTEGPHLAVLVKQTVPEYGLHKAKTLLVPDSVRWIVKGEEQLITTITKHTLTLIVTNLIQASITTNRERRYPLAAIAKKVVKAIQSQSVEKEMGQLLYNNDPASIPAPYPFNRVVFGDVNFYFGEKTVKPLKEFCQIEALQSKFQSVCGGRTAIALIDWLMPQIEKQLEAQGSQLKEVVTHALLCFVQESASKEVLRRWIITQLDAVSISETVTPVKQLLLTWIKAFLYRIADKLLDDHSERKARETLLLLSTGSITLEAAIDQLFTLFELNSGNGYGLPDDLIVPSLPAIKQSLAQFIYQIHDDLFHWHKFRPRHLAGLTEKEINLTTLISEKCLNELEKLLQAHPINMVACRFLDPASTDSIETRLYREFFDDQIPTSKPLRIFLTRYIESILLKTLYGTKHAISVEEEISKESLSLSILKEVLKYAHYQVVSLHRNNSTELPCCNELAKKILKFIDIHPEELPVPQSLREQTWIHFTEKLIPNLIKHAFNTYLTKEALEHYLLKCLKVHAEGTAPVPPKPAAPEEIRRQCREISHELLIYFDNPLMNIIPQETLETKMGNQIADELMFQVKEWPASKIFETVVDLMLEQLQAADDHTAESHDFVVLSQANCTEELQACFGELLEDQLYRAVASGLKKMQRGVKKRIKKNVGAVFRLAGGMLYNTGADFVDILSYVMMHNLFAENQEVKMVRNGSQSFILIPTEERPRNRSPRDPLSLDDFEVI